MPVIHPSGKFLYVMNFGSVDSNSGGDISLFTINGATGALTLSANAISGGGAQPMGISFNPLGTFAYVLYAGTSSGNTFSSQVKVYSVDATTGELTGPLSGAAACGLGNHPWSIKVDAYGKFAYVACLAGDEIITYSINSGTGALTNSGSIAVTAGSRLSSLAADRFGRFIYAARQHPWYYTNLLSYLANATSGALSTANSVLSSCPGGGCVGPMAVVAEPQGQFVYAIDVQQGLSAFSVDASTGNLAAAGSFSGKVYVPWSGGLGMPFTFGVTGTSPLWQSNCTQGCAMAFGSSSGGGSSASNPTPPTSFRLNVSQGAFFGTVTSSPGGINYSPPTNSNPLGNNNFSAFFPANSSVQLCTNPPLISGPFDVTWSGSCSGTGQCASVQMDRDRDCHVEFMPVIGR
jgi:6-phosphogluconolactonase (cycloisomerase 2 family)